MGTQQSHKGEFGGECYRTACTRKHAHMYNHSTKKYYCSECASMINDGNRADAMRLYGHDLCMPVSENTEVIRLLQVIKEQKDFLLWLDFGPLGALGAEIAFKALDDVDNILADYGIQ